MANWKAELEDMLLINLTYSSHIQKQTATLSNSDISCLTAKSKLELKLNKTNKKKTAEKIN